MECFTSILSLRNRLRINQKLVYHQRAMPVDMSWMRDRYSELRDKGLDWNPPTLEAASEPKCTIDGREMIMLSANNYLNLTTHPRVVEAAVEATRKYGAGSGSVRAIAGTMDLHLEAERTCAEFKEVEASLIYSAGYTANVGLIPTLVRGPQDVIISDELNHGSIIDGVRLTKASRAVYPHNDMDALERVLRENKDSERKLIITDGVFSMDGDIAPLDQIADLAEEYEAMTFVDDCHGEGVLGEGRGIVSHFGLQGRVTFEVGSFSKALGVQGGILAGSDDVRTHALNHSRSWLLSGSQPPGVAAGRHDDEGCHRCARRARAGAFGSADAGGRPSADAQRTLFVPADRDEPRGTRCVTTGANPAAGIRQQCGEGPEKRAQANEDLGRSGASSGVGDPISKLRLINSPSRRRGRPTLRPITARWRPSRRRCPSSSGARSRSRSSPSSCATTMTRSSFCSLLRICLSSFAWA